MTPGHGVLSKVLLGIGFTKMFLGHGLFENVTWAWGSRNCYLRTGLSKILPGHGVFKNVTWASCFLKC